VFGLLGVRNVLPAPVATDAVILPTQIERICMPIDDTPEAPASSRYDSPSMVSRRGLMKTAVGAGIAIAVAGTVGVAHASGTTHTGTDELTGAALASSSNATVAHQMVVAHVMDTHGNLELFSAAGRKQVRNADLAGRIAHSASGSPVVVHVLDGSNLEVFSQDSRTQIRNQDLAHRILSAV
jgi:hypothetical protein